MQVAEVVDILMVLVAILLAVQVVAVQAVRLTLEIQQELKVLVAEAVDQEQVMAEVTTEVQELLYCVMHQQLKKLQAVTQ
jgi:hypothetical protein